MFDPSLEVLRVVEEAAIASARTMGMGDPQAAVEAMRGCLEGRVAERWRAAQGGYRDGPAGGSGERSGTMVK